MLAFHRPRSPRSNTNKTTQEEHNIIATNVDDKTIQLTIISSSPIGLIELIRNAHDEISIKTLSANSILEKYDINEGDIITQVNNIPIPESDDPEDVRIQIAKSRVDAINTGEALVLHIKKLSDIQSKNNEDGTITLTIISSSPIGLRELMRNTHDEISIKTLSANSILKQYAINEGDVITKVNNIPIPESDDPDDVRKHIAKSRVKATTTGEALVLHIKRTAQETENQDAIKRLIVINTKTQFLN